MSNAKQNSHRSDLNPNPYALNPKILNPNSLPTLIPEFACDSQRPDHAAGKIVTLSNAK